MFQLLHFQSNSPVMAWERSRRWSWTHMVYSEEAAGSQLQTSPALAVATIWKVNQRMEDGSLSLCYWLSSKISSKIFKFLYNFWSNQMEKDWDYVLPTIPPMAERLTLIINVTQAWQSWHKSKIKYQGRHLAQQWRCYWRRPVSHITMTRCKS